jgi:hypothetical protein
VICSIRNKSQFLFPAKQMIAAKQKNGLTVGLYQNSNILRMGKWQ